MGEAQAVDLEFSLVSIGIKLKNCFLPPPPLPLSSFFPFTQISQCPAQNQLLLNQALFCSGGTGRRGVSELGGFRTQGGKLEQLQEVQGRGPVARTPPQGALLLALRTGLRLGEGLGEGMLFLLIEK